MLFMLSMLFQVPLLNVLLLAGPPRQAPAAKPAEPVRIVWSATRRLTRADFQGRANPGERMSSLTSSNINAGAACRDFVFTGTVQATFDPKTSWLREPAKATDALLRHEQLHFDLTEVHARLLRQKLVVYQARVNCEKLQPGFNNLTKLVYAAWDKEQSRYDQETNHGLNAERQAYWEKQTQLRLDQLQTFAEVEKGS